MRKIWVGLAVLAVAAVVGLYLASTGRRDRAEPLRTAPSPAAASEEPSAPEAPPVPAARVARIRVHDKEGRAVAGASVGLLKDGEFEGDPLETGADGRCELTLADEAWHPIAVRHPDYVQANSYVRSLPDEFEITLENGAPFTVLVLDSRGKPVTGAVVKASWERSHGTPGMWRWSSGEELGTYRTGEDGRARIGEVPQAVIVISVDQPEFALDESRVEVTGDAPVEHVVRLDSGGILMGRVVGPGGEGVPGATVKCRELARPVAETGAEGEFRLEGVARGNLHLVAHAEGLGPGFFGAALGWGEPVPIPLRSGETISGLEIVLSKPVYVIGRIVDDEGKPVKDVVVYTGIRRGFAIGNQAQSGEDGRFKAGPYSVREPGPVWAWFSAPHHSIEQVSGAQAEPGRDVDLGEIKATSRATIRGVLVDEAGAPVHAQIGVEWQQGWGVSLMQESKPDGTFELEAVGPGTVTLVATRADEPKLKSQPLTLDTVSGQVIEGVEIVLLAAKPIKGRVITPDGKPRPGAVVGIRPASGGKIFDREWTDNEGKFTFGDLAEGEYEVGIIAKGTGWGSDDERFLDQPPSVKAAPGRDDLEFIVPLKGGIITGKVVAKADGQPLKEFEATFLRYKLFIPSDTDYESYQNQEGTFRYEADEPGTWQVDVSAPGYAAHRTDRFSLGAGEVKDIGTIRLGPGGTIAGRVLDAQQRPVPYTRINILNEKLQTNDDEPFTDLDGRFEVPGVSPGAFSVFAVSPSHPLGFIRGVEVREGERTDVQITFVQPAPLTIDVRDPSGQPIEGAKLDFSFPAVAPLTSKYFRSKIPPGYGSHESDKEGTIFQPCLPPGEVTITIEAAGYEPVTKKLELKPGQPNRIEISLRPTGGG